MLLLTAGIYYFKNFYINVLSLLIVTIYVLIANKNLIGDIKKMIFKKIRKKEAN